MRESPLKHQPGERSRAGDPAAPAPGEAARTGPDARGTDLTPLREQQLLQSHRAGSNEALAELLRGYQSRIYAVCYRMLRSHDEAAELTQDAMVRVLEGLSSYDGRSQLSTWIIRVTMNCCLSYLRRQKLRRHASLEDVGGGGMTAPGAELRQQERVEHRELNSALLAALDRIVLEARAIIMLRDMQDLDYQQIAEVLGVPVGTVKSRLFRARAALRSEAEAVLAESSGPRGSA